MSIKEAQERRAKIFERKPDTAKSTGHTHVILTEGTRCEVTQGDWKLISDQPTHNGGANEGPDPGFFGRAALGACLAQGYAIEFAKRDLKFTSIKIDLDSDIDARGAMGLGEDIVPGYQQLRYTVFVESAESEDAIKSAIETAESTSPWLYNFKAALDLRSDVSVIR